MSFCDFKGIWVITKVNILGNEIVGHRIAIGGRVKNVMILCVENPNIHIHPPCCYDEETDSILGPAFQITRSLESHPINTGSWTAEDPGGMDGDKTVLTCGPWTHPIHTDS